MLLPQSLIRLFCTFVSVITPTLRKMKAVLRLIYSVYFVLIAAPLFALSTVVFGLMVMALALLGEWGKRVAYIPGVWWARSGIILSLCRVQVVGREHYHPERTPYVVMANHQGAFDILMMYGYLNIPFRWVMKASLRKVPVLGKACASAGFIFLDRGSAASIKKSITEAQQDLGKGVSIFIFPEGSRTATGKLNSFKKGGFIMAEALRVAVLPVVISGSFKVMPRTDRFPIPHPGKLRLEILPEIHPNQFAQEENPLEGLRREVFKAVAAKVQ